MQPYTTTPRKIELNGHTIDVVIEVYVEEDHDSDPFDQDFILPKAEKALRQQIESGKLFNAFIYVVAKAYGEAGTDSLGGCIIPCNNAFNSKPFDKAVHSIVADNGMEDEAIQHLKQVLVERANSLKQFATK